MSTLHPRTKAQLESLAEQAPQAALLYGLRGSGVDEAARELAHTMAEPVHIHEIVPEKTGISIEQVRELYVSTRSSTDRPRVFIVRGADQMSHPAQNALLKLLEEPTAHTTFLLVSHEPQKLLSTIHSRVHAVEILPMNDDQTAGLLDALGVHQPTVRAQLIFIAGGLPDELTKLARDEEYRKAQFDRARQAKALVGGTLFDKLKAANTLAGDRELAKAVLNISTRMLSTEIARQPDSQPLLRHMTAALRALEALGSNGNVRAQLLRFVMAT